MSKSDVARSKEFIIIINCFLKPLSFREFWKSNNVSEESRQVSPSEQFINRQDIHLSSATDGKCTGLWPHPVSNVYFRTASDGRLYWDYRLSPSTRATLGSEVTTLMTAASVNNRSINPPYNPHTRVSTYNFHGSMINYQYIGRSGGGTIKNGDWLLLTWFSVGVLNPRAVATRTIACQVVS